MNKIEFLSKSTSIVNTLFFKIKDLKLICNAVCTSQQQYNI